MGGVDTHPNLPAVEPGWLPPGAWRWIAAAVPVGAAIGLAAAALYGVGPLDPDTGADRTTIGPSLAAPPPLVTTTRDAPAPRSTAPVVVVIPDRSTAKGPDEPDTTATPTPDRTPTPTPTPSGPPTDGGTDGDGTGDDTESCAPLDPPGSVDPRPDPLPAGGEPSAAGSPVGPVDHVVGTVVPCGLRAVLGGAG